MDTITHWCGTEEVTLQLTRTLAAFGEDVQLVVHPRSELRRRAEEEGLPLLEVTVRTQLDPIAYFAYKRLFKQMAPDVVQLNASKDYYAAGLAAKALQIPLVIRRGVVLRLKPHQLKYYNDWAAAVVAPSEAMRRQMLEDGVKPEKLHVIPNCVDLERLRPAPEARRRVRAELNLDEAAPVIALVARFTKAKGHAVLLEALPQVRAHFPGVQVLFAGKGDLEGELRALANRLGVGECVHFLGFRRDVPDLYAASDVAVVPSIWAEAFGYAAVEALAAGTPVVASRSGALPEVVPKGQAGLLVPPGEPEPLAEALVKLLREDELRRRLGEFGRRYVEKYDARPLAEQYLELYRRLSRC